MTLQIASRDADAFVCKKCSGLMRLGRVDSYPMPRGSVEIVILECSACGSTLQQVQAKTNAE